VRWSADLGCHDIVVCVCVMCIDLLIVSVVNVVVHWSSDLGVLGFLLWLCSVSSVYRVLTVLCLL